MQEGPQYTCPEHKDEVKKGDKCVWCALKETQEALRLMQIMFRRVPVDMDGSWIWQFAWSDDIGYIMDKANAALAFRRI